MKAALIFFHIPKTGGQTFNNLLDREYRDALSFDTHIGPLTCDSWKKVVDRIKALPASELQKYSLYKGHMRLGLHEFLPPAPAYVTLLRRPLARSLAYYRMYARWEGASVSKGFDFHEPNWGFRDPVLIRELDNGQVRALSGADPHLPLGHCTEDHLSQAQQNIMAHFNFVGLLEKFDLSLMALTRLHGWRWHFYQRKNVNMESSVPLESDTKIAGALSELNGLDERLYRFAEERFREVQAQMGLALNLRHRVFISCNWLHQGMDGLKKRSRNRGMKNRAAGI